MNPPTGPTPASKSSSSTTSVTSSPSPRPSRPVFVHPMPNLSPLPSSSTTPSHDPLAYTGTGEFRLSSDDYDGGSGRDDVPYPYGNPNLSTDPTSASKSSSSTTPSNDPLAYTGTGNNDRKELFKPGWSAERKAIQARIAAEPKSNFHQQAMKRQKNWLEEDTSGIPALAYTGTGELRVPTDDYDGGSGRDGSLTPPCCTVLEGKIDEIMKLLDTYSKKLDEVYKKVNKKTEVKTPETPPSSDDDDEDGEVSEEERRVIHEVMDPNYVSPGSKKEDSGEKKDAGEEKKEGPIATPTTTTTGGSRKKKGRKKKTRAKTRKKKSKHRKK